MTPDQALDLAKFQRSGVKLIVGLEDAREEAVSPLSPLKLHQLPGDASWHDFDLRKWLGFVPSLWAKRFSGAAADCGHEVSAEEWRWLHGPASLVDAKKWLDDIIAANPVPMPEEIDA